MELSVPFRRVTGVGDHRPRSGPQKAVFHPAHEGERLRFLYTGAFLRRFSGASIRRIPPPEHRKAARADRQGIGGASLDRTGYKLFTLVDFCPYKR